MYVDGDSKNEQGELAPQRKLCTPQQHAVSGGACEWHWEGGNKLRKRDHVRSKRGGGKTDG